MSNIAINDLDINVTLDHSAMTRVSGGNWFCGTVPGHGERNHVPFRVEDILKKAIDSSSGTWDRVPQGKDPFAPGGPLQGPF